MSKKRQLLDEAKQEELMRAYQNTNNGPLRTRYQAVRLYGMGYKLDFCRTSRHKKLIKGSI